MMLDFCCLNFLLFRIPWNSAKEEGLKEIGERDLKSLIRTCIFYANNNLNDDKTKIHEKSCSKKREKNETILLRLKSESNDKSWRITRSHLNGNTVVRKRPVRVRVGGGQSEGNSRRTL